MTMYVYNHNNDSSIFILQFSLQDLERLYPNECNTVQITLIEANEILSSFDTKLRSYTEHLIKKRSRMKILKASVTSNQIFQYLLYTTHIGIVNLI